MPEGTLDRVQASLRPRRRFRLATGRARLLPSFLVIGAQRAGTTSLFRYLRFHPDVAGPAGGEESVRLRKELHFFDQTPLPPLDWYRSFFPLSAERRLARLRGRDLVAGESSPYYLFHPEVPARVAETLPDVRLIALLRDPVDRAYSHYLLMRRKGSEPLSTFEEAVTVEEERLSGDDDSFSASRTYRGHHHHRAYLRRGRYAEQLERWFEHVPRERLLVLRSEDLLARPAEIYGEVLAFLGLEPWQLERFERRNHHPYAPIDPALRAQLAALFVEPNAHLEKLLGRNLGWSSPAVEGDPAVAARER